MLSPYLNADPGFIALKSMFKLIGSMRGLNKSSRIPPLVILPVLWKPWS